MADRRKEEHVDLPFKLYMVVRPEIEQLVINSGRPMTYHEVKDHLFDTLGMRRCPSSAQIGNHISRSKKLERFRYGEDTYVVAKKEMAKERGWTPERREAKMRYLWLLPESKGHKRRLMEMCKYDLKYHDWSAMQ